MIDLISRAEAIEIFNCPDPGGTFIYCDNAISRLSELENYGVKAAINEIAHKIDEICHDIPCFLCPFLVRNDCVLGDRIENVLMGGSSSKSNEQQKGVEQ